MLYPKIALTRTTAAAYTRQKTGDGSELIRLAKPPGLEYNYDSEGSIWYREDMGWRSTSR